MKKFISFDDWVLSIDDVVCTCRHYSWYNDNDDGGKQKWYSGIYLTGDRFIKIKEEYFDELKEILLNYEITN